MSEENKSIEVMEDVLPVSQENRTLSGFSLFAIWFACNLVTTTMLTGMYFVPGLTFSGALAAIVLGCIVGVIPLILIGVIGQKSGLVTMVASRGTFGCKGAILPSAINVIILVGWSWAQAGLGGLALNYILRETAGFDNTSVCIVITEVLVIIVSLFAIRGISIYEKFAMVLIAVIMGFVIFEAFAKIGTGRIFAVEVPAGEEGSVMAAFDIVVATALSWTPMAADYNRNAKSLKGTVIGTGGGYALGTILSMGSGALMICMVIAKGLDLVYEPSQVFGEIGFGMAGAIVIFVSIIAANVMCVYSATVSFINAFPKLPYRATLITIGIICVVGALFSGILDAFLNFVYMIGVLFMPIFSIMIADFFIVQKSKLNIEAIVYPEKNKGYWYRGGVNWIAITVFVIAAAFAYIFTYIYQLSIGATIPTFFVAFVLYIVMMKLSQKRVN